jgi:DNA-binding NarL/FixJ family response regulator
MTEKRHGLQKTAIRAAIFHDVPLVSAGMASALGAHEEFVIASCERPKSRDEARAFWGKVDVAVTDFATGVDLMRVSQGCGSVLIVTHDESEAHVRMAIELGVRGYILLGCNAADFTDSVLTVGAGGTALGPAISARIASSLTHQPLTPRELTVLRLVCVGFRNKEIALRLCLSCGTVKSHLKAILSKLNAKGRTEASSIAQRRGIVPNSEAADLLEDAAIAAPQSQTIGRSFGAATHQLKAELPDARFRVDGSTPSARSVRATW